MGHLSSSAAGSFSGSRSFDFPRDHGRAFLKSSRRGRQSFSTASPADLPEALSTRLLSSTESFRKPSPSYTHTCMAAPLSLILVVLLASPSFALFNSSLPATID